MPAPARTASTWPMALVSSMLRAPAAQELGGVVERRGGDQVLDVADEAVPREVGRVRGRRVRGEVAGAA